MSAPWQICREMFLSEEQVDRLLNRVRRKAPSPDDAIGVSDVLDRLIVELLLLSGLRNSELCRLAVGDTVVATGQPLLAVRAAGKLDRNVYIPSGLNELIVAFQRSARRQLLPAEIDPDDLSQPLVFHERRRPYERTGLYRRVVRILSEAGLGQRASVQLLRHTYGYLAYLRSGGNLLFTQRQLGHAHPMVTSIYAQFVPESYTEMAEAVAVRRVPGTPATSGRDFLRSSPNYSASR